MGLSKNTSFHLLQLRYYIFRRGTWDVFCQSAGQLGPIVYFLHYLYHQLWRNFWRRFCFTKEINLHTHLCLFVRICVHLGKWSDLRWNHWHLNVVSIWSSLFWCWFWIWSNLVLFLDGFSLVFRDVLHKPYSGALRYLVTFSPRLTCAGYFSE